MTERPVILCVDDDWDWLKSRKLLLEERGYQVLAASNGVEALHFLTSVWVDLVLLDYHLPHMNGDMVAERMKAIQPEIPIVMLSADEELPENALRWVDAFMSKDESPSSFLEIVEYLVDECSLISVPSGSSRLAAIGTTGRQRRSTPSPTT